MKTLMQVENVGPDYGEASTESNFAEVGVLIHVGEGISWAELGEGVKIGAELRVLSAAGLWALLLNGDAAAEKDIENDPSYITLYRGVSAGHTDYLNAIKGEAHPYDYYSTTTPEGHNGGNYKSAFTSWTISPSVANYHANKNGPMGIVLIKRFPLKNTIPSPDEYDELEVLIRGSVYGALPTRPTGPGTPTAY